MSEYLVIYHVELRPNVPKHPVRTTLYIYWQLHPSFPHKLLFHGRAIRPFISYVAERLPVGELSLENNQY